jgi:hypothetical protein
LVPTGEKPKRMETDHPKAGSEPKNVRLCSLMFAYVRLCSLYGKKMFEAPILIPDASALGSSLKKRAVAALGERRPVYFCGKTASPTAATVSSEFFKGWLARRAAGGRRTGLLAAPGPAPSLTDRLSASCHPCPVPGQTPALPRTERHSDHRS